MKGGTILLAGSVLSIGTQNPFRVVHIVGELGSVASEWDAHVGHVDFVEMHLALVPDISFWAECRTLFQCTGPWAGSAELWPWSNSPEMFAFAAASEPATALLLALCLLLLLAASTHHAWPRRDYT
jgi:hypothetical protein